ncbi:hypothetical protein E2C01_018683 [Portunus trituberculatus]|uniref:Uncharacterized protein n=1 Tax=Portunus trituberculatus TaxID=210409 RepID=A0A5B7DX52_PORTR|nr:hypothetical protein [Portunus trituberculatus]
MNDGNKFALSRGSLKTCRSVPSTTARAPHHTTPHHTTSHHTTTTTTTTTTTKRRSHALCSNRAGMQHQASTVSNTTSHYIRTDILPS